MKTDIVIMASGNSKRFEGGNKLLHMVDGKRMFEYAVDNAIYVKEKISNLVEQIIVVSKYSEIEQYCEKMSVDGQNVRYIHNDLSSQGITASIHLGTLASYEENNVLFMVGDQPYFDNNSLCRFIVEFNKSGKYLGCVQDVDGHTSNPCIFADRYKEGLLELAGDRGGKSIIKKAGADVYYYTVENIEELTDIDENY